MQHLEGSFTSIDGLNLYYQSWHPLTETKAALGIVHGLGSHSGLFDNLVNALVPCGYAVYGLDLRGHGRSPGQRGYINHWAEFRADFGSFWQLMINQNQTLPCFVLGHSLGAVIILDYALRYPQSIPGIIAIAPALKPVGVPPIRVKIGQILSWVLPRFTLNTGIPQNAGSRNAEMIAAYLNDSLRHTKGTARLVTEFFKTTQWIQAHLTDLRNPILTLHGSQDLVALPESSQLLFEQISILDKEYREYPGGYHDLHNDTHVEQVIVDIASWLDRHIKGEFNQCYLRQM